MPKQKTEPDLPALIEQTNDLLRKHLIIQMVFQGVPNHTIRDIVKCDMNYITKIVKPLKERLPAK